MDNKILFGLIPAQCGSTAFHEYLSSSPNVSEAREEQRHEAWKHELVINAPYDRKINAYIDVCKNNWDYNKPVLLDCSPNILDYADTLEKEFENSYFIISPRNPFARLHSFISNTMKITKITRYIIDEWINDTLIKSIEQMIYYEEELDNVLVTSYEEFASQTDKLEKKLLKFIPELEGIDKNFEPRHTNKVYGGKIKNYNNIKITKLRLFDIMYMNDIINNHRDLFNHFGYKTIKLVDLRVGDEDEVFARCT